MLILLFVFIRSKKESWGYMYQNEKAFKQFFYPVEFRRSYSYKNE